MLINGNMVINAVVESLDFKHVWDLVLAPNGIKPISAGGFIR